MLWGDKGRGEDGDIQVNQLAKREAFSMVSTVFHCWIPSEEGRRDRYNQTEQLIEHRNCHRHNPCHNPQHERDTHPGAHGNEIRLVHAVAVAEESDVDVFGGDVAVDDSADDDLLVY